MQIACILTGGPTRTIRAGGKVYSFEMHPFFGPAVLGKQGEPLANQPGPNHAFWVAVDLWHRQGQQVGADGLCVWKPGRRPILRHLGGRHYEIAGYEPEPADEDAP